VPGARISACLIVQDEQERLPAALASVAFCDEIVVVDGGSRDATVAIARAAGAKVIENPWPGYARQRNLALETASGEWALEIDADERVSPRLGASMRALVADPPEGVAIAVCPLRNRFLGGLLGPSAKYPAYRSRLFRRDAYRHEDAREVHEGIEPRERPAVLEGDLEHELAGTLGEALADTWSYARLESRHVEAPSARAAAIGIVLRPAAKLLYRTFVDGGWRDGWRGMLKLTLDASSDGLVWALALARRGQAPKARTTTGGERAAHFERRPAGAVKVVALADAGEAERARRWLAGLAGWGIDVALVTDGALARDATGGSGAGAVGEGGGVPVRAIAGLRPLAAIRALEMETQMRTTDAVVPVGRRAELVWRVLPFTLRPQIAGLSATLEPERAAALARAGARRTRGPTGAGARGRAPAGAGSGGPDDEDRAGGVV